MFIVQLRKREAVARQTYAFHLEKPSGFRFKAGQFLELTLAGLSEAGAEGNTRSFSIASAPSAEALMVVTRMRDTAFKRALAVLPLGSCVAVRGPYGSFVLPQDPPLPLVLIAGGVGITPFLAMLRQGAMEGRLQDWLLLYANREPDDAPFLRELAHLQSTSPGFRLIATMSAIGANDPAWKGERGRIDEAMLSRYIEPSTAAAYYIAGPAEMVKGVREMLARLASSGGRSTRNRS